MKRSAGAPPDRAAEMFDAWKRGTPIHQLVIDYAPTSRSGVRKLLTTTAGGVEQFRALRALGAGGRASESSSDDATAKRSRAARPATSRDEPPRPRIDDSNVPMVLSAKRADGWTHRRDSRRDEFVYTSPEGVEYVRAADTQPADLIHIGVPEGLPPIRLRRYVASGRAQRAKEDAAAQSKLEAQQRAQRDAKRTKRRTKLEKRITKTGR